MAHGSLEGWRDARGVVGGEVVQPVLQLLYSLKDDGYFSKGGSTREKDGFSLLAM